MPLPTLTETEPMVGPLRPLITCPGSGRTPECLTNSVRWRLYRCPVCKVGIDVSDDPTVTPDHDVDPKAV